MGVLVLYRVLSVLVLQKLGQVIYCCRQVRQEPVVVIDLSQKRSHFSYIV